MNELILQSLADEIGSKSLELALVKAQLATKNQEYDDVINELNRVMGEYNNLKSLTGMDYNPENGEFIKKEESVNDTDSNS